MTENDHSSRTVLEGLLAGIVKPAHVAAGDFIFRSGSAPRIALIRTGMVRVFVVGPTGRQLTVRYGRPGDLIGLAPLLGGKYSWSAEAVIHTSVELLTMHHLQSAAARHPELPWLISEHIATWASNAIAALAETYSLPMTTRIARHLGEIALPVPNGTSVAHITQQRLADAVGTAREVVSRELRGLRAQGVIATEPQRVEILDKERLERIARGPVSIRER